MRRLLGELGSPQQKKTVVLFDNQSCIAIAKNLIFHARTKHIEIQYHFVREKVLDGTISLGSIVQLMIMLRTSSQSLYCNNYLFHTLARLVWVTSQELRGGVRVCTSPVCL